MLKTFLILNFKNNITKPIIQGVIGATFGLTTIFTAGLIHDNKNKNKKKEIPLMSVRPVLKKIKKADEADKNSIF